MPLFLNGTDNSATTPAVQGGTGGTTTGVYYPAINQIAISTNGTQALLIDSSQNSTFTSNGAVTLTRGTTAQQPASPVVGMLRYNTSTNQFEGYSGASPAWASVGGAAISNDTANTSFAYPLFASSTSGTALTVYTSNAKLLYKPSTGDLQSSQVTANNGIFLNSAIISNNYTIQTGYNAHSVGPVTMANGVTVTISSGQRWLVF
jgi:hypothetical protein